jgi:hypothetical protein
VRARALGAALGLGAAAPWCAGGEASCRPSVLRLGWARARRAPWVVACAGRSLGGIGVKREFRLGSGAMRTRPWIQAFCAPRPRDSARQRRESLPRASMSLFFLPFLGIALPPGFPSVPFGPSRDKQPLGWQGPKVEGRGAGSAEAGAAQLCRAAWPRLMLRPARGPPRLEEVAEELGF